MGAGLMIDYGIIIYIGKIALSSLILGVLLFAVAAVFNFIYDRLPVDHDTMAEWARNVFFVLSCLAGIIALICGFIAAVLFGVNIL